MKFLVTFTYFFVFAMTPGIMDQALETGDQDPRSCLNKDHIYYGCEYEEPYAVEDWHVCGQICTMSAICQKWHVTQYGFCILHDCSEAVLERKDGAYSGDRGCI